ncbi:MAG: flagellar biosynthetic protein FliR [Lachnospiraceae bacterium]|nr:flagellar biosynthetic protein FliR [Lachnospiraceae bacterium]
MLDLNFSVQDLEYFLLIFVRITCFLMAAPFYSTANVPYRFKVGLGFFSSLLIYQYVAVHFSLEYHTVIGYSILVLKEAIAGVFIGLSTNLPLAILTFSGKLMDMEAGLSMMSIFDPTTRITEGFTGMFYHYMVLLILIVSGMHRFVISAFIDTYRVIRVGMVTFDTNAMFTTAVRFLTEYVVIGIRICLPVFAAILVVNVVLGINAKVAPQMNMFAVGVQIKLFAGLAMLLIISTLMPEVSSFIYTEIKKMMATAIGVLS